MGKGGGGLFKSLLEPVSDVAAFASGFPELIPLINAGETTGLDLASGKSLGKSLGQGAISGGEAFGAQQAIGALGAEFPQTAQSLGLPTGGNSLSDLLGVTQGAGSIAGPGTIGGDISSLFSSTGLSPGVASGNPTAAANVSGSTANAMPTAPTSTGTGGGAVGGPGAGAASLSAPASVGAGGAGGDATFSPDTGNTQLNSLLKGFSAEQTAGQPVTDALSQQVISASNAASPGGTDVSLNQPGAISGLTGSAVPQSAAAAGAATGAGAAAGQGNTGLNLLKSLTGSGNQGVGGAFNSFLGANANLAVPAGILGYEALSSGKEPKGTNELRSEAGQIMTQGSQLQSYIQNGTLPPGFQGAIQQNLSAQQAAIKSRYAAQGMSGSSAEQQDLQNAAVQSQAQSAELAMGLLSQGINETGQSAGIYQNLLKDVGASDAGLTSALAAFASAAAGGNNSGQTLKINVGQ